MGRVATLRCRECGREEGVSPVAACADCWGGLEAVYDLDEVRRSFSREAVARRPLDLWRYAELLPVDERTAVGRGTGFTPLLPAPRLARRLGIRELWIKHDAACHPTLSFKDRLVAVALSKAREFGIDTLKRGLPAPQPVKPDTLVRSLAIGDPADGASALATIRDSGGRAEDPTDAEALEGVRLLAETEGLFTEAAGGTVVAAARRLAANGAFEDGEPVVLLITGHGLKTVEHLSGRPPFAAVIDGKLSEFETFWAGREAAAAVV